MPHISESLFNAVRKTPLQIIGIDIAMRAGSAGILNDSFNELVKALEFECSETLTAAIMIRDRLAEQEERLLEIVSKLEKNAEV